MSITIKLRRTNQSLNSLTTETPAEGEAIYSFADKQLVIGNGSLAASDPQLPRFYAETWQGNPIGILYGGTGNNLGYIRTGLKSGVTAGTYSTAEGSETSSTGHSSHAEGLDTTSSAARSHAEGYKTTASGNNAHAEGSNTTASGSTSHAEGSNTTASGSNSHSSGTQTIANHKSQFVFGEFNISDPSTATASNRGTYIEIVGNGTADNARSNARTLDFNGNESLKGNLIPMTTNSQTIGTSTNRWKAVYIGTQSTIGENNKPIYWNNGVPTVVSQDLAVNITGTASYAITAGSANKLSNAKSIQVKLNSTSAASFDGTDNIKPGVDGILPVSNGGTGSGSVDSTPMANSQRMVTSGGVYSAIQSLETTLKYAASDSNKGAANRVKAAITFSSSGGASSGTTYNGSEARTISYNTIGAAPAGTYAGSSTQGGAANSVKAAITFNNSGSGSTSGTTYNGSTARTISYNTIGAAAASHTHNYAGSSTAGGAASSALTANQLTTGRTLKVKLNSTDPSTAFNGTQNISDIGVSGTLAVSNGGTGLSTTGNINAVVIGSSSSATANMQTIRTNSGAFYATAQDGKPQFGILPVAQGGTGKSSYTTNGVFYASGSTVISQSTSNTANQILMSNSNKVPIWQSPTSNISNNNKLPPTSESVYAALENLRIENLPNLSNTYVWDSLSSGTYYITREQEGRAGSPVAINTSNINKISTWTSCTAISATQLSLSGTPIVYSISSDPFSTVTIPANKYCIVELNNSSSSYTTTGAVFYTGSSSKVFTQNVSYKPSSDPIYINTQVQNMLGSTVLASGLSYSNEQIYWSGTPGGSTSLYSGPLWGNLPSGINQYSQYVSTSGTMIYPGGAVSEAGSWTTQLGGSNLFTHGISGSTIHLCRGSLADIILQRRIGSYSGNGTTSVTLNFNNTSSAKRIPRVIRLAPTADSRVKNAIDIDTYGVTITSGSNNFQPVYTSSTFISGARWTNNNCLSLSVTLTDSGINMFNKSGNTYQYYALA